MDPHIESIRTQNNLTYFRLRGANVSLANALRRVILAEIPCVVLRSETKDPADITIDVNTSRLNNELIRQRLSCVPVHIQDTTFSVEDHAVELDVENASDSILMVTSGNFKIKNTQTDTYLTPEAVAAIFPRSPITGDYIDLVRLRPAQSRGAREAIRLQCRLGVATASENAAYSVACTCAYGATTDQAAADEAWKSREAELKQAGSTSDVLEGARADWEMLGAKRYTIPDSFDFVLESVGQFTNDQLVVKAIDVITSKLEKFAMLEEGRVAIGPAPGTMENAFLVTLRGEGYTLGKLVEYALFSGHYEGQPGSDGSLVYCGFDKPHPHIDEARIRVAFKQPVAAEALPVLLREATAKLVAAFESLGMSFQQSAQ